MIYFKERNFMRILLKKQKFSIFSRLMALLLILSTSVNLIISPSLSYAQNVAHLPSPGTMVSLSSPYTPIVLKGIKIYPENPFRLDFIVYCRRQ